MTTTDQDAAAERAARELARRLGPTTNLRDPLAAAADFMTWLRGEHWKCIPPPKPVALARQPGVPATEHAVDLEAARKACEAASTKIHGKDDA